jgi:hypothetical protein
MALATYGTSGMKRASRNRFEISKPVRMGDKRPGLGMVSSQRFRGRLLWVAASSSYLGLGFRSMIAIGRGQGGHHAAEVGR